MKSAPAIAFDYQPSRALLMAAGFVLLLALVAVALSGFGIAAKCILVVAACAYAGYSARRVLLHRVKRCAWHEGGQWRVRDSRGEEHAAVLLHATARGPLIALVFQAGALRRVSIVLLPDNCDAETRRRLRVRLARADAFATGT